MLKSIQKYRKNTQLKETVNPKFAVAFFVLSLIILGWVMNLSGSNQLKSSVIFDTTAQTQLKPYTDEVKAARNDYRKAIGQGNGGAYDKYQEATTCTARLDAQIEAAKELRSDYQQLDAAIGVADHEQAERWKQQAKNEATGAAIGAAFNANDAYWVELKREEAIAKNLLETTNAGVGNCLELYDNNPEKCLQQKADWDKAQDDYAKIVLKIKNAVKERELETLQKIESPDSINTDGKTSFFETIHPAFLKAGIFGDLFGSATGAVSSSGTCGVVGSGAVCQPTSFFICPDGWQGYSGGGDCASGYKCCTQVLTFGGTYQTQQYGIQPQTQTVQPSILNSITPQNQVSQAATGFLGGLLSSGGEVSLGGKNWNIGVAWPSSTGSTAIINGPGAAKGLSTFKTNYKGNTYGSVMGMIAGWTNFALPFVSVIAIAALVYAGFLYITAFGNDEQTGKAKKIIIWVVIGIIIIISAYALVNTLISGNSTSSSDTSGGSVSVGVGGSGVDVNW